MQVPRDPVPVLEHGELLSIGPPRRELKRDRGLRRKGRDHARRALRQRRLALAATHGEHAAHVARRAKREQDCRADVSHRQPGHVGGPRVGGEVIHRDGLTAGQHLAG